MDVSHILEIASTYVLNQLKNDSHCIFVHMMHPVER